MSRAASSIKSFPNQTRGSRQEMEQEAERFEDFAGGTGLEVSMSEEHLRFSLETK